MGKKRFASFFRFSLLFIFLAGFIIQPQSTVYAAPTLTIVPITWNIIGLDSNSPAGGPYLFPVGARVCSAGATTVTARFKWGDTNDPYTGDPYINLRAGTNQTMTLTFTAAGCQDAYFEVQVAQVAGAYNKTRRYYITAENPGGADLVSTPMPRELFVEHLISQNRNAVTDIKLNGVSIPAGGSMTMVVGNTYTVDLIGGTATQGYNQFESFINFPNTIFQIVSKTVNTADGVLTNYAANNSPYVTPTIGFKGLYADACKWDNDPGSPNYRSCIGGDYKTGGAPVTTSYTIKVISGGGTTQTLNSLLYDFSGSSFHYNADYSVGARTVNIIDPTTAVNFSKVFVPSTTTPGGISKLTFTIHNNTTFAVGGLNFKDTFPTTPGAMTTASATGYSTTGCGTPTLEAPKDSGSFSAGAASISFKNGTVAAGGDCIITVNVIAPTATPPTYDNTSDHLFIDTADTNKIASASLTVTAGPAAPACANGMELVRWTWEPGATVSDPTWQNRNAAASATANGTLSSANSATRGNPLNSWATQGWSGTTPASGTPPWLDFTLNTSKFSIGTGFAISVQYYMVSGEWAANNTLHIYSRADSGAFTAGTTYSAAKNAWTTINYSIPAGGLGASTTTFRLQATGAKTNPTDGYLYLDNLTITGCAVPEPPTITKSFSPNPIARNGTSTLTFTITNTNNLPSPLTGISFVDNLPTGVQVAATPNFTTTCGGTPNWGNSGTTLNFGTVTPATVPARVGNVNGTCTASVTVTATTDGPHDNVSDNLKYALGGTTYQNTGPGGSASDTLVAVVPLTISKTFVPSSIVASANSTLTFTITNPNQNTPLAGVGNLTAVAFSDQLPVNVTAVTPVTTPQCGGGTVTYTAATRTITLTGGTLAVSSSCTVQVTVTSSTAGTYNNVTGTVTATAGTVSLTGNTANANLTVTTLNPSISLTKQISTTAPGTDPWSQFVTVSAGTPLYYRFKVYNDGDVNFTALSVSDPTLANAPTNPTLDASTCSWRKFDGTAFVFPLVPGDTAYCVLGPTNALSGSHSNTATVTGTYSTGTKTATSTATYGTPGLTIAKSVTETSFSTAGDLLHYSYLVTNSGSVPLLGPVTVSDNKITLPNTVTCPAVNTVGDGDDWLDPANYPTLGTPAESITCTATYTIVAGDVTAGFVTNTASATVGGVTSNTDSKTVNILRPDLTVVKSNNVTGTVAQNGTFTWTLTVANGGTANAVFTNGQTILSDLLPVGPTYGSPATGNFTSITNSANINCSVTAGTLSCTASGADVTIGTNGSFTVSFTVTPDSAGSLSNTATVDPLPGSITESNETNNNGSDTVTVIAPPSISKSFGAASVALNGTTTLSFTITNPNAGTTLTGVAFSDTLPSGLTVADSSTAQCGGTLTTTAATGVINLSGASILGGGNCTFNVTVTGSMAGAKNNTTGNVTSTNGGTGNTASASTTVVAPPVIVKSFGTNPIAVNGTSIITFTITNPAANTVDLTGVAFIDTYPVGMQNAAAPDASTTCTGGTVTAAANGPSVSLSGASIAVNSSCTVSVTVTGTTAGTKFNSVAATSTNGGTGNTATAKLGVISAAKSVVGTSEDSTTGANVAIGEIVRYRLVIDLPEGTTTNLQLLDNIITNMAYLNDGSTSLAFICNSGPACATSSTAAIGSNPVISGNAVTTPTFVLPAAAITNNDGGGTGNPFPDGDNPMFSLGNVTNNDNDSDAEYVVLEFNSLVRNTAGNNSGNTRGNTFTVYVNGSALTTTTSTASDQVTIREPVISAITKSVTTTPTDAGDTITYQLQFTNTGTAPAFDISVTDALNAVLTTPVTVTGSTAGGACGSTVSSVSGSYSAPNATATVTCLAVGGTATINITATVSNTALAGYTFTNSSSLTYTSLPGSGTPNGSGGNATGSTTPGASGTTTGERNGSGATNDYTATSNTVSTTLANPSVAKTINPAGTTYAIGATIPYEITITVPEGVTGNPTADLVETIPTGLVYDPGSLTVIPDPGVTIATTPPYTDANPSFFNLTGQTMRLTFGSFTSTASGSPTNRTIVVTFLARVDNVIGNQSGTTFANSVDFTRTNPNGAGDVTLTATAPTASVIEPVLSVSKSASTTTPAYSSTLTYTLTVGHTGASNAPAYDTVVTDALSAGLTALTNVNLTSTAPANCATGVVNNSNASVLSVTIGTIPLGCTVTITYDVTVSGAIGSTQTNSVNAAWTSQSGSASGERTGAGGLNDYVASTSQSVTVSGPDLSVTKTDGSSTYTAGTAITYTITVNNIGNATATGTVADTFPASLTGVTWTCAGTGGATCGASGSGNISDPVSIPVGQSVTYTVIATVLSSTTDDLVNTATATLSSGTDPTPGNNSSTDTDTPNPQADLSVTKTDGKTAYTPGGSTTYTIVVSNAGPSNVTGATFADTFPAVITSASWTCTASAGSSCTASGTGNINDIVNIPAGGNVTYTVTANISAGATGDLVNTATITVPVGTTDPTPGNNSASDTDTVNPIADLAITKDDGVTNVNANGTTTYSIVVTNNGPSAADNAVFTDPAATELNVTGVTCGSATGGAACPAAGNTTVALMQGAGIVIPTLPNGGSVTFTVTATVTATSGSVTNTASIAPPSGTTDPTPGNNNASDTDTVISIADLAITKTDGVSSVNAGGTTSYTIVVTNNGPSVADNAVFTDPAATGLNVTGVTCGSATGGAACPTAGNTTVALLQGAGIVIPTLPNGGSVTFTVTATVTATSGSVTNTASIAPPSGTTDPTPDNNNVSDTDTVNPIADLSITKTDGVTNVNANDTTSYTIVVTNNGPSAADNAVFTDPAVTGLNATGVTCGSTTGGAACPTVGNTTVALMQGAGIVIPTLPNGGSVTFTVNATVTATSGSVTNTATIAPPAGTTDPNDANNIATDTDTVNPIADLSITKTDGVTNVNANGTTSYTIVVTNNGPSAADNAVFTDPAVTGLNIAGVTCGSATGGAVCPTPGNTTVALMQGTGIVIPTLPNGGSVTFTVTATVTATSGSVTNTATIAPPSGTTDPNDANNIATDTDTVNPIADLAIMKDDGVTNVNANGTTSYTIVVTNNGPSAADNAIFTDPAVTGLTVTGVTCGIVTGGAACPTAGNTTVVLMQGTGIVIPTLPNGGSVTFTVTATVTATSGSVTNTATIAPPSGTSDPTPVNNNASDTDTVIANAPAILLTKTPTLNMNVVAPNGVANAGDTITYTFSVQNTGNVTLTNITLSDTLLAVLSCTPIASLASGATQSFVCTGNVYTLTQNDVDAGSVANTATATGKDLGNNNVTDPDTKTITLTPVPSLVLTKTPTLNDAVIPPSGVANAGDTITYTFSVQNTGNVTLTNVTVGDTLLGGLNCTAISSLAPNAIQSFTCTGNVYSLTQANIDNGSVANTATATGTPASGPNVTDPDTKTTILTKSPSLTVVKEISASATGPWNDTSIVVTIGDTVYYRVRVTNTGNTTLTNLIVTDSIPACVLVRGPDIKGNDDAVFDVGEEWSYSCFVTAVAGTTTNTATADTTETQPVNDTASYAAVTALVVDPAISKVGNPTQASVGETVTFTLTVTNNGTAPAPNVVVTDPLPAIFDVVSVTSVYQAGGNAGTDAGTISVSPAPAPYTVTVNLGTLNVTDVVIIMITTTVNGQGNPPIVNTASISTSALNDPVANDLAGVTININAPKLATPKLALPATGFAPNVVTSLPAQPQNLMYAATDVVLEIPSLGVRIPIVGIPKKNGSWDVSWLAKQAGWLEGSAFPSWKGNSVLTGHVYDANGLPGPFVDLGKLKYGDKIIVHAYGEKYVFEVRTNQIVAPNDTSALKHEEKSWLTLITCKEYDQKTNAYKKRVVVRAVLVKVEGDDR